MSTKIFFGGSHRHRNSIYTKSQTNGNFSLGADLEVRADLGRPCKATRSSLIATRDLCESPLSLSL
jgi:hypothetical protein